MAQVLSYVKEVTQTIEGKEVTKRFTNFYIEIEVEGNKKLIPVQPVNFGEKQNRRNYQLLSMIATKIDNLPF